MRAKPKIKDYPPFHEGVKVYRIDLERWAMDAEQLIKDITNKSDWYLENKELKQQIKELKESLNVAKYKDHKEDETDKERRDRINRFRSGY